MAKMKENTRRVWDYLVEHDGEDVYAQKIADELGIDVKSVNGSVTRAFQAKGLTIRVPAVLEDESGEKKNVKLIQLTDEGRAFDPDAEEDE